MSRCLAERRQQANHAAAVFEADPRVVEAVVVGPSEDPTDRFLVDVALGPRADGLPTELFANLSFSLTVRHVAPQGDGWIAHCLL